MAKSNDLNNDNVMFKHTLDMELTDDDLSQFIEFIEKHNITYKQIGKNSYFSTYVAFTGNAKDIIQLVLTYFADNFLSPKYVIESAYEIIFQG